MGPCPELPEVETVVRGLRAVLEGRVVARLELRRADLRFPFPAGLPGLVEGRRIAAVRRRAKYILIDLDDSGALLCHLGMSGRMIVGGLSNAPYHMHDHVILRTREGGEVRFNDPRRFGMLDYRPAATIDRHPLLAELGPEPLSEEFTGPVLGAASRSAQSAR